MEGTAKTTQALVSEYNRSSVLEYLYHNGVCSRAQLADALSLTPAALTKISARLLDTGIIEETGGIVGRKNRRSIGLRFASERLHVIGVKFARSLVQIGVFDLKGTPLSVTDLPDVTDETIPDAVRGVHEAVGILLAQDPNVIAIGMAVPGPYLRTVGRTALVSSMQGWRRVNFLREFGGAFRVPVFVEQDARAGVLAQSLFSESADASNLAYYLLGEGVGLGVIDHGELINGAQGAATEIGHVSIDVNGRPCDCGNVGCLERYCSAVAIHHDLVEDGTIVPGAASMSHRKACMELFKASDEGDEAAQSMVDSIGRFVGFGCVTIINAYNPDVIVLGDIVSHGGDRLLAAARRVVDERVLPELNDSTDIHLSDLPEDATILGAAAVAIDRFLDHPSDFLALGA